MNVIGIDPGQSGAIAIINGQQVIEVAPLSKITPYDVLELLNRHKPMVAYIEKVHAMPGQGVTSMFNFGENFGMLKMALAASGSRWHLVTPQAWQKDAGLIRTNKNESNTDKKNRHKAAAQRLFPSEKITHAIADALLIAYYGQMQETA